MNAGERGRNGPPPPPRDATSASLLPGASRSQRRRRRSRARRTAAAPTRRRGRSRWRSEEHTFELQSLRHLVCRLLLEKKKTKGIRQRTIQKDRWSKTILQSDKGKQVRSGKQTRVRYKTKERVK